MRSDTGTDHDAPCAAAPGEFHALKKKAINGVFWSNIESWGRQIISLVIVLVMVRLLTPREYGVFAIVMVVLEIMKVFVDDGFIDVIVQRTSISKLQLNTLFFVNLGAGLTVGAAAIALTPLIASLFGEPELLSLIPAICIAVLVGTLSAVHQAILRRELDFQSLAKRSVVGVVGGGVLGIATAAAGFGIWSLVVQQIAERLIGLVVLYRQCSWRPALVWSTDCAREVVPSAAKMIATRFMVHVEKNIDRFFIGLLLGPTVLGLYTLARRLLDTVLSLLIYGTAHIAMSTFSRLQTDPVRLKAAVGVVCEIGSLVIFPVCLGLALTAPAVLPLLMGERWAESASLFQLLVLGGIPFYVIEVIQTLARAMGKLKWTLVTLAAVIALNLLVVLGLHSYGIAAIAAGLVVRDFLLIPAYLLVARHLTGISIGELLRPFFVPFGASLLMGVAIYSLTDMAAAHWTVPAILAFQIAAGVVIYGTLVVASNPTAIRRVAGILREVRAARSG